MRRSYRVEDFLWTGSGDGQDGSSPSSGVSLWRTATVTTTTVFRTTTVLTTVFPTPVYTVISVEPSPTCVVCTLAGSSTDNIQPTPTVQQPSATATPTPWPPWTERNITVPDQRYWLLTILQTNTTAQQSLNQLEARLARLYRIAFYRQQERHLGIGNATALAIIKQQQQQQQQQQQGQLRLRRARDRRLTEPVSVQLLNMTSREPGATELLYSVHVAGKPVLAHTAAADMRLVSDSEVTAELGYPILTKAEPYLKGALPLDGGWRGARTRDTWLLVGAAVAALCLILLLVALLALGLGKRKRNKRRVLAGGANRRQVFEQERGASNLGYDEDDDSVKAHGSSSSKVDGTWPSGSKTSPHFHDVAPPATVTFKDASVQRQSSTNSDSSSSQCSEASLVRHRVAPSRRIHGKEDTEQEVIVQPQPRKRHHPVPDSRSQPQPQPSSRKRHQAGMAGVTRTEEQAPSSTPPPPVSRINTAISPNSYLSMPSIKSFPRGANIPEPLARVLEPITVKHLDSEDVSGIIPEPRRKLVRHASVEGEDPGVLGPLVWDLHCHRLQCTQQQGCLDEAVEDLILGEPQEDLTQPDVASTNVSRMRRRFHELLDDAFSLFGSRSASPGAEEDSSSPPPLQRVHSAIVRPVGEPLLGAAEAVPRPRTSYPRRPATAVVGASRPRGAWGTAEQSPCSGHSGTLPRPLSAGPFHRPHLPGSILVEPTINRTIILSDSQLAPSDPAVPLIAAIKEELRKFQGSPTVITLPGSTSSKT
ncbi:uncharacterized protein [Anabrus simplex]